MDTDARLKTSYREITTMWDSLRLAPNILHWGSKLSWYICWNCSQGVRHVTLPMSTKLQSSPWKCQANSSLECCQRRPYKVRQLVSESIYAKKDPPRGEGGNKGFIPSSTSTAICLNPLGDHLLTSPSRLFCSRISYLTRTCMEWDCGQPPSSRQTSLRCNGLGTL